MALVMLPLPPFVVGYLLPLTRKTAKPKRIRHEADSLRGITADMNRLDEVAGRLGV
jgi:hypothetical protein